MLLAMDDLATLHPNGLFLRREALDFGYNDRHLTAAVRDRALVRVRQGVYVSARRWLLGSDSDRYRLRGQAVCLTHNDNVALSHTSGAAELGLRLWEPDLSLVHVTRLDGGPGGRKGDIVYHVGAWTPDDVVQKEEMLLLAPVHAALGAASLQSVEGGLVTLDSLLDLDLCDLDGLRDVYRRTACWPNMRRMHLTVRLVRDGAQSAGESRSRYLCWAQNLPEPELQFEVYDESGRHVGTTDFAWPEHGLLGEFDGKIKYGRLLRKGEDASDVVFREKVREDRLREVTGWIVVRLVWSDLHRPQETAQRIRRLLRRGVTVA